MYVSLYQCINIFLYLNEIGCTVYNLDTVQSAQCVYTVKNVYCACPTQCLLQCILKYNDLNALHKLPPRAPGVV